VVTQATLDFTIGEVVREGARSEQDKELARVSSGIAKHILAFCKWKGVGATFRTSELNDFVCLRTENHVAPGSSDRVLRDLRMKRLLDYEVLSRRASLYKITRLAA
jgi:hypothetical protein